MKLRTLIVVSTVLASGMAHSADLKRGAEIYQQSCAACHAKIVGGDGTALFTRSNRRVQNFPALEHQVRRCKDNLGINLSDEQVNDVTAYLNANYYKFK